MNRTPRWPRRRFLRAAVSTGAAAALNGLVPGWARSAAPAPSAQAAAEPLVFDLALREHALEIAGGRGLGVTVNGTIPGPLLEWREGSEVLINVTNHLDRDTSIHWHGILLPFEMDGVPGVAFRGISPGATFQYRFPVKQSGTYWYHSHSELQEQSGLYGPLVIHPRDEDPVQADRDYVLMLSDWTFEDPHDVLRNLKKMSDYYNYRQFSLREGYGAGNDLSADWRTKLSWDRMRMMPTDIADVTGATYSYLMNGLHPEGNWTGFFRPGERVRLRVINGSAMTHFNLRIP
ncbi:MAG TPA: multicopper oxidase domain-containing protein, partial [Woeseiaceae bacterium]|nr:multicopper oxidase domain-containing protein [Woeseiaceae bacterium]